MVLERAIQIISDQYLSGMQALYADSAEILKKDLEAAEIFLAGFNVKIAPRIGSDPITPFELAEYIQIAGPKEAEIITTLAGAKAELAFGNRLAACPLIAEAIRQTESPEELQNRFRNALPS
jgi:phosphoribosylcarboxyaminoimidazole (NCAIR) mutase